ncbi:exodeoxyribonuclease V subunit gamma [Marinomonas sp. A79]|uniref:Exodeoxyribonuclease V subunit gamma n=1 Tax=Marinomonas vulgaris TaxID=2823372 RepID=A0ABS5HE74_9GAMM|nr:exodeoxyribonuclease V subunit gamma [Marinomonas vulgaris]MBR7889916.1 exodeoxyribonuclease V subunit gamma [Marinomonas vulgaris]
MLHLYTSRNFKVLVNEYLKITSSLSAPVFTKTPVVVPNKAIGRWLQQQVATSKGISVNLDPVLPAKYAWSLLRKAEKELTEQSDFSSEVMLFSIRKILDDAALNVNFTRLGHYLNNCCDSDRMVLAGKISRIFDLYQVYRGDWLSEWQVGNSLGLGEDEPWQKAMWNLLSDKSEEQFRSQQELALLSAVKERTFPLPKTLCIFGVASLPKSFIELIQALSEHCECYVFAFSALEGNGLLPELMHWHQTGEDCKRQSNPTCP